MPLELQIVVVKMKPQIRKFSSSSIPPLRMIFMVQTKVPTIYDAATDPRIDPQTRNFLAKLNKSTSPFWELPKPKVQTALPNLQAKIKELSA